MNADRFWAKVDRRGPDDCWNWTGARSPEGYGRVRWGERKTLIASRVAWTLANGPIPAEHQVCHSCDNPSCVNPAHLWLGTALDNVRDCLAKGRQARGERHRAAKLTASQVTEIRGSIVKTKELARIYGVDRTTIQRVRSGHLWRHAA